MSSTYYTDTGNTIHLDKKIGSGGEGDIYLIHGYTSEVAKIYKKQQSPTIHRKLLTMVQGPPHDPTVNGPTKHRSIAWPSEILYLDRQKTQFAGFVMPRIDLKVFKKILIYLSPEDRAGMFFGEFTWLHLYTAAFNLASCLAAIHERGYCVGDINESNILVAPTTLLTIIDCDSFQVKDPSTGKTWRCKVAKDDYTAPEIFDCSRYADVDRTRETDCFALAVMIFQLLMEGFHPYAAKGKLVDDAPSRRDKIKKGIFPYTSSQKGIAPTARAPSFEILHPEIQALFQRCFDAGHKNPAARPSAKEWMTTLKKLSRHFKECTANKNHRFLDHLNICPWCERNKKFGESKDSFPNPVGQQIILPDPTNQLVSLDDRKAHLLPCIEMALMDDGYISQEEEAYLIEQGLKLHIPEKETKRLITEEIKKRGIPVGTGSAVLSVSKNYIEFREIKKGTHPIETIEVSNVGDGIMTGTISSNARWLKVLSAIAPCRKNQSQKIQLSVNGSNLPYGFSGSATISIKTTGGNADVTINLTTESLSHLTACFRSRYAPLSAALGGFLFSFGHGPYFCFLGFLATVIGYPIFIYKEHTTSFASIVKAVIVAIVGGFIAFWILEFLGKYFPHFIGFVIGAYLIGGLAYLAADLIMKHVLNAGMNLSRFPPILVHGLSAGLVILAIAVHSGDSPSVKKIAEREVTSTTSPQSQKQRIVSSPTTTKRVPKSRVRITRSVVAAGLNSNNRPVGISTNFSSGLKKLWHFVEYKGAMKNKTVFRCQWYKDGRLLTTISYQLERSSGNAWCPLTHNYKPGKYEVRLFADDNELKRTCFYITKPSKLSPKPKNNIKHSIAEKQSNHSSPQTHSSPVKQSSQTKPGKRLLIPPSRDSF